MRSRVGVFKLASCSGCINELIYSLASDPWLLEHVEIKYFLELQDDNSLDELDIAIIEGSSVRREHDEILRRVRDRSEVLIAMGTCATQGGIHSLRSEADVEEAKRSVYPAPQHIDVSGSAKAVSEVVRVDISLGGCPVNGNSLASVIKKVAMGGWPVELYESLCAECKRKGVECVIVMRGLPCLGPITSAGCGAICPLFGRGCYGCSGINEKGMNASMLSEVEDAMERLGLGREELRALLRSYSARSLRSMGARI